MHCSNDDKCQNIPKLTLGMASLQNDCGCRVTINPTYPSQWAKNKCPRSVGNPLNSLQTPATLETERNNGGNIQQLQSWANLMGHWLKNLYDGKFTLVCDHRSKLPTKSTFALSYTSPWSSVQRGLHHHFPAASHRNPGHYLLGLLLHRWPCRIWLASFWSRTNEIVRPEEHDRNAEQHWASKVYNFESDVLHIVPGSVWGHDTIIVLSSIVLQSLAQINKWLDWIGPFQF